MRTALGGGREVSGERAWVQPPRGSQPACAGLSEGRGDRIWAQGPPRPASPAGWHRLGPESSFLLSPIRGKLDAPALAGGRQGPSPRPLFSTNRATDPTSPPAGAALGLQRCHGTRAKHSREHFSAASEAPTGFSARVDQSPQGLGLLITPVPHSEFRCIRKKWLF